MRKSLVAFDTNHIKQYVFGTDKLREIRGASSILDKLNRYSMRDTAKEAGFPIEEVYTNGGGGLFLIDSDKALDFGQRVQRMYREQTGYGASITYLVQELPEHIKTIADGDRIKDHLESLRWRLREKKLIPLDTTSFPTHPFMRTCDSCGVFHAAPDNGVVNRDPGKSEELYCTSCQQKRQRDTRVKRYIEGIVKADKIPHDDFLWKEVIERLEKMGYDLSSLPGRPEDFNVFSSFKGRKDYFALIYADANGMGKAFENCEGLSEYHALAKNVDGAIYQAVCSAIAQYLKVTDHVPTGQQPTFPFDILLMGGDDVLMAVPATVALDVALTIAKVFQEEMQKRYSDKKYGLSVGVVIAPIKYPFRLLESLATTTLNFAKDEGNGEPRINFVTVAGSAGETFGKVFDTLHTPAREHERSVKKQFFATLRPYDPDTLDRLLQAIRKGRRRNLGRSKLHQMREAILKMNLTTSVSESRAVLMNWKDVQRDYVIDFVHTFANQHLNGTSENPNPETLRYERPFPWFFSEKKGERSIYRTPLLDFIELYDFVSGEEVADGDTH